MDSDPGKLFIGGISWETSEDKLKDYFGQYGEVLQAVVMKDKLSGRPRGFGFVVFADPSILDTVLQNKHFIDGRALAFCSMDTNGKDSNSDKHDGKNKPVTSLDSQTVVLNGERNGDGEEDDESGLLLPPRRGGLSRGGLSRKLGKPRRKVQWNDKNGNKLVEVLEFQPSDVSDSDDEESDSCICIVM